MIDAPKVMPPIYFHKNFIREKSLHAVFGEKNGHIKDTLYAQ